MPGFTKGRATVPECRQTISPPKINKENKNNVTLDRQGHFGGNLEQYSEVHKVQFKRRDGQKGFSLLLRNKPESARPDKGASLQRSPSPLRRGGKSLTAAEEEREIRSAELLFFCSSSVRLTIPSRRPGGGGGLISAENLATIPPPPPSLESVGKKKRNETAFSGDGEKRRSRRGAF